MVLARIILKKLSKLRGKGRGVLWRSEKTTALSERERG
jgi:hypothetical protein